MLRFLVRKFAYTLTLVVVATTAAYLLAATQLKPRARWEGRNPPPAAYVVDSILNSLNANDKTPVFTRLGRWASGVVRGDFGLTIDGRPVSEEIGRRVWVSFRLMLIGAILGSILAVALGSYAAVKQYSMFDVMLTGFSFLILSMPIVVLAVIVKHAGTSLNLLVGFTIFYNTGEISPGLDPSSWIGIRDRIQHMVLPTLVLMMLYISIYGRYQRNAMLDVLGSDFLRTAQAKGLPRAKALIRHGLRTALIPMVTFFVYQFALLFIGATFTETIFAWNGMGQYFVQSVTQNDINSVAGVTLIVAVLVLAAGFLSDIAYAALDPRVRTE